jgi:hypothetical protein
LRRDERGEMSGGEFGRAGETDSQFIHEGFNSDCEA